MNQQLFDLDRALDDFEHEELDKLASNSSQSLFSTKQLQFLRRSTSPPCPETSEDANNKQRGEGVPSIICLLNSSSGAVSTGETTETSVLSTHNHTGMMIHAEVLDEDTKDSSVDFVASHGHLSNDRTSHHLVLEEQSSSNMDSGLCSSSEFTSLDAGDLSTTASSQMSNSVNNALLQNFYTTSALRGGAENYEHALNPPNEPSSISNHSYSDDVSMLFSPEKLTSGNNGTVTESDSTIRTPTLMSPARPNAPTPVGNSNSSAGTLSRHNDVVAVASISSSCSATSTDSQTPTRPAFLEFSSPSRSNNNRMASDAASNDAFFFPDAKPNNSAFHSLPVVSNTANMMNGNGSSTSTGPTAGGCRRPSSLLLSDSSATEGQKPVLQHHPVGTKRPSSLFGLPCVASGSTTSTSSTSEGSNANVNNLSPQRDDKKMMLKAPAEEETMKSIGETVMMDSEPAMNNQKLNFGRPIDQTAAVPVATVVAGFTSGAVASGRRSPSTCSANSEIIQLPIPAIPSSTSSCSPDSASLSRSSLDLMPSPMTQPPSFVAGAVEMPIEPVVIVAPAAGIISSNAEDLISPETPVEPIPQEQVIQESEDAQLAALAALEAESSSSSASRILPCGDTLGRQAPPWVPDSDAPNCSGCGVRFTFTKRRHHCRACGKVYCNSCCSLRYQLEFLNEVARVCVACYPELVRLEARRHNSIDSGPPTAAPSALKNVLKGRGGSSSVQGRGPGAKAEVRRSKKKVVFSDGVAPGEQVLREGGSGAPSNEVSSADTSPSEAVASDSVLVAASASSSKQPAPALQQLPSSDVAKSVLPIVIKAQFSWASDQSKFMQLGLESVCDAGKSVVVTLNSRLAIRIQRVDLSSCCSLSSQPSSTNSSSPYYAIVSMGMCAAAESEYMVIIRTNSLHGYIEVVVNFFERVWADAEQGRFYDELSCVIIEPVGFLVFRPSFQCTQHLTLPNHSRWLASIVVVDPNELAWARLFPLRLLLRLGHEFSHYPTPIISDVTRLPLFHLPGHTVLSLFSDFRTFRYRLESIDGAVLHLDRACNAYNSSNSNEQPSPVEQPTKSATQTTVNRRHVLLLPATAANQVRQLALAGNEHVLAIGTSFSPSADGHLVAVQAAPPDATYRTEAITMLGVSTCEQIRVVAASFIIFNGSLRPDPNGARARLTVIEDGAMLQITSDQMTELRSALAAKQNYKLTCSTANMSDGDNDSLQIEWIQNSVEISSSPWTRPQSALRCRLPIGFNSAMTSSLAQVVKSDAFVRVAAAYSWPFDPVAQAVWCSPTVYATAALSSADNSGSSSTVVATDPMIAQSAQVAYVLDRSSLAFASATQLALAPFADLFARAACSGKRLVCDLPVQLIVRIRLDPDNLGFEATMFSEMEGAADYLPLPDAAVESLDSELIPTLFNVAQALGAKLPPGGLCFEFILFSTPPVILSEEEEEETTSSSSEGPRNSITKTIKDDEALAAEMLIDDN